MNNINVFDNIAAPLKGRGYTKAQISDKVNSLLNLVGLNDKANAYPRQLSGGQNKELQSLVPSATIPKFCSAMKQPPPSIRIQPNLSWHCCVKSIKIPELQL